MDWSKFEQHLKQEIQNIGGRYIWTDVLLKGDHHVQKNIKSGQYRLLDGARKTLYKGSLEQCKAEISKIDDPFETEHLVLLIHGLGRHAGIMDKPKMALRNAGFSAHSLNYATLFEDISHHGDHFEHLINNLQGIKKISFVTHSLGGLVAREILKRHTKWNDIEAYKLVMMGTPNKGAQIAEFLNRLKAYQIIAGPSGQDVRPLQKLKELPEPTIPTLVIAGGRDNDTGYNPLLKGDNDGIVSVDETRLDCPHQFKLVHSIHTTMMDHKEAIEATVNFLLQ